MAAGLVPLTFAGPAGYGSNIGSAPPPISQPGTPGQATTEIGGPSIEEQVVILVNQARWNNGQLPPLKHRDLLDNSSELHSSNMAVRNFFAHCDPDTLSQPWDRMASAGYSWNYAAENIAAGYNSPTAVMAGWMASSGHRANILSTGSRELGVGYYYQASDLANVRQDANGDCVPDSNNNGPYYHYWTQNFGRIDSVYPVVINREAYETSSRNVNLYVYGAGWAQEMRFSNSGGSWSAWEPYQANKAWTLAAGTGPKTVLAEIRQGGTVRSASDTIWLNDVTLNLPPIGYLPLIVRQ
jgi:uncharacterized protein YkwD